MAASSKAAPAKAAKAAPAKAVSSAAKSVSKPVPAKAAPSKSAKSVSKSAATSAPAKAAKAEAKSAAKSAAKTAPSKASKAATKTAAKAGPVAPPPFDGFPKDFLAFFREIAKHNDREWFAANKERFRVSVQLPMLSFIAAMDLPLGRFADCFVADPRTQGGSMFRIYNDMRFHDAKPYKEHAACQFRHEAGKDAHAPGFYVQFEPKEVFFGGGIWRPPGPQLRAIREAIEADPERWTEITRSPSFKRRFGAIEGESLKRPPQGFDPEHPLIDDIKKLSFFVGQIVEPEEIQSKNFVKEVSRSFEALGPFMRFLTEALGLPYHHDD